LSTIKVVFHKQVSKETYLDTSISQWCEADGFPQLLNPQNSIIYLLFSKLLFDSLKLNFKYFLR